MAVVSGRLQIRDWQDKDGNKRRSAEVIVDSMYFGDSKKDGQSAPQSGATQAQAYAPPATGQMFTEIDEDDGDLPF